VEDVFERTNHCPCSLCQQLTSATGIYWFVVNQSAEEPLLIETSGRPDASRSLCAVRQVQENCGFVKLFTERHQLSIQCVCASQLIRERTEVQKYFGKFRMGKGMQVNEDSYAVVACVAKSSAN